jgi:hypothetical protein
MGGGCKARGYVDFDCVSSRLGAGQRRWTVLSGSIYVHSGETLTVEGGPTYRHMVMFTYHTFPSKPSTTRSNRSEKTGDVAQRGDQSCCTFNGIECWANTTPHVELGSTGDVAVEVPLGRRRAEGQAMRSHPPLHRSATQRHLHCHVAPPTPPPPASWPSGSAFAAATFNMSILPKTN